MRRFVLCIWVAVLLPATRLPAQGQLESVRQEVSQPTKKECPATEEDGSSTGDFLAELFGGLFAEIGEELGACIFRTRERSNAESTRFLSYPYAAGFPGYLVVRPVVGKPLPDLWEVGGRLQLDNGNDFSGLNRFGGQFFLEGSGGFGLRLGGNWFNERLPGGRGDDLFLGDATLTFRLIELERFQTHVGVGLLLLSGHRVNEGGINVTAGFDLFPARPVVVSAVLDVGTVGSASTVHYRGTVGYVRKGWELFGGYDHRRIGAVHLSGPLIGVRCWF